METREERLKFIRETFKVHSFARLVEFNQLLKLMNEKQIIPEELTEFINAVNDKEIDMMDEGYILLCPKCSKETLALAEVNTMSANQIEGDYNSQIFCNDDKCDFEKFYKYTVVEIHKLMSSGKWEF